MRRSSALNLLAAAVLVLSAHAAMAQNAPAADPQSDASPPFLALAEPDSADPNSETEPVENIPEDRQDYGIWSDLDTVVPFDLTSFNVGLALSVGRRPYRDVDTDYIVFPIISRFTDADFTDQIFFCRSGSCGVRYARDWFEIGAQGRWTGLGYERGDSPFLLGMIEKDSTLDAGPMVGVRTGFVQIRLQYFQDVLDNHDGSETRLTFDFPFRFRTGFFIPHVDVYQQDTDFTNYYYGILPERGDRFEPGCVYNPTEPSLNTCQSYLVDDDSTNIDVGFRSEWKVGHRWYLHVSGRVELLDDNITDSPIVDGSPDRWSFRIGFSYDIDYDVDDLMD